jgi:protein SCO1
MKRFMLTCLAVWFTSTVIAGAALPGASLYQLPVTLQAADGSTLSFSSLRGQPLLITMFFSHCSSVCPLVTLDLQNLEHQLTAQEKSRVRIVMVSFDSQNDTPAELQRFARERNIDTTRWILARANAQDVRLMAAALGIRYRELPDHSFNHSTVISLLDQEGVVRAKTLGVQASDDSFLKSLKSLSAGVTAGVPH